MKIRYKSHHDVSNIINKKMKRKLASPFAIKSLLKSEPKNKDVGIYVHTPFCDKICSFCNMNRKQVDNSLSDYSKYLVKEFEKYVNTTYMKNKEVKVIFFGGGTPTIYKEKDLENILIALNSSFNISVDCEFTFETTLHNLTPNKLKIMEKHGVNRLSIGIQTFSDRGRKLLNRTYSQEIVIERLKEIKNSFNGLVCIDIIYNYPDQTLEEIQEDARILCKIGVDSSSFYSLMIQEGSQISKDRKDEKVTFKYDIERDKLLHDKFLEITLSNGYHILEHTKISNGKDKYRYIEFVNNMKDLLPIGVGAGGRLENIECYHLNKLISFYAKDDEFKFKLKKLSGIMQYNKVLLEEIKFLTGKYYSDVLLLLKNYENSNLIKIDNNFFTYTIDGVFWGNTIITEICEKLISLKKS